MPFSAIYTGGKENCLCINRRGPELHSNMKRKGRLMTVWKNEYVVFLKNTVRQHYDGSKMGSRLYYTVYLSTTSKIIVCLQTLKPKNTDSVQSLGIACRWTHNTSTCDGIEGTDDWLWVLAFLLSFVQDRFVLSSEQVVQRATYSSLPSQRAADQWHMQYTASRSQHWGLHVGDVVYPLPACTSNSCMPSSAIRTSIWALKRTVCA